MLGELSVTKPSDRLHLLGEGWRGSVVSMLGD